MEQEFLNRLDNAIKKGKLTDAEELIENTLELAIKEKNTNLIFTVLNEAIGFYRDTTNFETSLKYASSLIKLLGSVNISNDDLMISYINIANIYRASGKLDEAIKLFEKIRDIDISKDMSESKNYAAYLNNFGLAYQERKDYEKSIEIFTKALKMNIDKYKEATTYTNMAISYLKLSRYENALYFLDKAEEIFEIDKEKDFHYSGYLAARASFLEATNKLEASYNYYEKALSYLDETVGKNKVYLDIEKHIKQLESELSIKPLKGLELNEYYYNDNFKAILEKNYRDILSNISVCSIGFGSDKIKLDDELSRDHDFEPGFIILVDSNVTEKDFLELKKDYDSLNKHYKRYFIRNESNRNGVFRLSDYENALVESDLSFDEIAFFLSNGKIFMDEGNLLKNIQSKYRIRYEEKHLERIAKKAIEIAQLSEYNIERMRKRDSISYRLLENELIKKLIEFCYLKEKKYYVDFKWQIKIIENTKSYKDLKFIIEEYLINSKLDSSKLLWISKYLINYFYNLGFIKNEGNYFLDYQYQVLESVKEYYSKRKYVFKIIEIEWEMFQKTKNIDGRADCQDNYPYFELMRKSQYFSWNIELLESYLNCLSKALNDGLNLITYKYGYMEESTNMDDYIVIKDKLPKIDDKTSMLIEGIISLQMEQLEKTLNIYPKIKGSMRTIYTKDDSEFDTSYETYLRGELKTYDSNTLVLYAKYLVELDNKGVMLPKKIIALTYYYLGIDMDKFKA